MNTDPIDNALVESIADGLIAIERNYYQETSGPGSRFEGQRLEIVQARWVIKEVRRSAQDRGAS